MTEYVYDALNRLTEVKASCMEAAQGSVPEMGNNVVKADIAGTGRRSAGCDSVSARYAYDPLGRRVRKVTSLRSQVTSDMRYESSDSGVVISRPVEIQAGLSVVLPGGEHKWIA